MTLTATEAAREALDAARRSVDPVDLSWLDPQRGPDSWTVADDTATVGVRGEVGTSAMPAAPTASSCRFQSTSNS